MPVEAEREGLLGQARSAVELKKAADMLPLEIKKAYAVADAHARASRQRTGQLRKPRILRPQAEAAVAVHRGWLGLAQACPCSGASIDREEGVQDLLRHEHVKHEEVALKCRVGAGAVGRSILATIAL